MQCRTHSIHLGVSTVCASGSTDFSARNPPSYRVSVFFYQSGETGRQTDPTATRISRGASRLATYGLGCIIQAVSLGSIPLQRSIHSSHFLGVLVLGHFYLLVPPAFPGIAVCGVCLTIGKLLIGSGRCLLRVAHVASSPALRVLGLSGGPYPGLFMDTPAPTNRELSLAGRCPLLASSSRPSSFVPGRFTAKMRVNEYPSSPVYPYTPGTLDSDIRPMGCSPAHYRSFQSPVCRLA